MSQRSIAMLVNPGSGRGRGARNAPIAARRLRERGLRVTELIGGSAEESASLARVAVREGADALVACGGDGTLNLALQAVAETDTPLGILPVGTGDDNARTLGIPLKDVAAAADVIADGKTRSVDCGHVSTADGVDRYFLGVMSVGFDSEVTERANDMSWPHGQARYLVATLAELRVFAPLPFTMTIDGTPLKQEAMLVAVGNGISYGGGMKVCPDANVTDGLLDMTVLAAVGKMKFVRTFPSVFKGTHVEHDYVSQHRFREATIDAPNQVVYADGERIGTVPAIVRVKPAAVNVFAPTS
ncbi:MAG: diacylglycerol kinase [Actinobacteria bacterium]|nr:diacylglycerol kinase [Actinomycetota bacterium]